MDYISFSETMDLKHKKFSRPAGKVIEGCHFIHKCKGGVTWGGFQSVDF